jgi:hypothetical protein
MYADCISTTAGCYAVVGPGDVFRDTCLEGSDAQINVACTHWITQQNSTCVQNGYHQSPYELNDPTWKRGGSGSCSNEMFQWADVDKCGNLILKEYLAIINATKNGPLTSKEKMKPCAKRFIM